MFVGVMLAFLFILRIIGLSRGPFRANWGPLDAKHWNTIRKLEQVGPTSDPTSEVYAIRKQFVMWSSLVLDHYEKTNQDCGTPSVANEGSVRGLFQTW